MEGKLIMLLLFLLIIVPTILLTLRTVKFIRRVEADSNVGDTKDRRGEGL